MRLSWLEIQSEFRPHAKKLASQVVFEGTNYTVAQHACLLFDILRADRAPFDVCRDALYSYMSDDAPKFPDETRLWPVLTAEFRLYETERLAFAPKSEPATTLEPFKGVISSWNETIAEFEFMIRVELCERRG